jgi:hypothetical protein
LLRADEIVNIQMRNVFVSAQKDYIKLHLDFRKTHQGGHVEPFYLYRNTAEPHLCPVRSFLKWLALSNIRNGYLFRFIGRNGHIDYTENRGLDSKGFSDYFERVLHVIKMTDDEVHCYGSHSLRRGGTQYLFYVRRWPLPRVLRYGGWSKDLDNKTIVSYITAEMDDEGLPRAQYFVPTLTDAYICSHCGRTCNCR